MKELAWLLVNILVVGYVIACSPTKFEKQANCTSNCVGVTNNGRTSQYDITVDSGKLDILIVDDNSASMSTEQHSMASKFSSLISALESRGINYRIAITTSDISASSGNGPRPINQNGALQDGRLITFGDGTSFLTPSTANRINLFSNAIQRAETISCESFLSGNPSPSSTDYSNNCPSGDERGIFAANLVVKNNPASFLRADASLAVVFLSDEDVRSSLYPDYVSYTLSSEDLPQTLINNVASVYPGKNFAVHSIIVKPGSLKSLTPEQAAQNIAMSFGVGGNDAATSKPSVLFNAGDSACLATQNAQVNGVKGSYGYLYALATRMTGGVEGNICAGDYAGQLTSIGNNAGVIQSIDLNCANPSDLSVTFVSGTSESYVVSGSTINFAHNLATGTKVRVQYSCTN